MVTLNKVPDRLNNAIARIGILLKGTDYIREGQDTTELPRMPSVNPVWLINWYFDSSQVLTHYEHLYVNQFAYSI